MKIRYFGQVEHTRLRLSLFEANRLLKVMSTGFDNLDCRKWLGMPPTVRTELELFSGDARSRGREAVGALLRSFDRKQEVRIFLNVRAYVNHACRADELLGINLVNAAFGQIFTAYPVNRCIKMRPGMFTGFKAVPVPGRPAIIVT